MWLWKSYLTSLCLFLNLITEVIRARAFHGCPWAKLENTGPSSPATPRSRSTYKMSWSLPGWPTARPGADGRQVTWEVHAFGVSSHHDKSVSRWSEESEFKHSFFPLRGFNHEVADCRYHDWCVPCHRCSALRTPYVLLFTPHSSRGMHVDVLIFHVTKEMEEKLKDMLKALHLQSGDARMGTRLCVSPVGLTATQSAEFPFLHDERVCRQKKRSIYGERQSTIHSRKDQEWKFSHAINKSDF